MYNCWNVVCVFSYTKFIQLIQLFFFRHAGSTVSLTESTDDQSDKVKKPWKIINKHVNKNKREKARRLYAHLDQH